jgi:hypothetical protein
VARGRLAGLSMPAVLLRRDVTCFLEREVIVRKSESDHFIRVIFSKELFRIMQSLVESIEPRIELPLDQGWSFLSVLCHAAFEPRFFYRFWFDYSFIRIYCEFARLIAK